MIELLNSQLFYGKSESFLRFTASPGLYQFSVIADGAEFDWEELYITLNTFHNSGQRTGPWDFHLLEGNRPLVPSYWVYLDGQRLGLWYFQRISLEDLAARRFRGRLAFWLRQRGEHELKFVPYRNFAVEWVSSRLEVDPEDTLWSEIPVGWTPQAFDHIYWSAKRDQLENTHSHYRAPLARAFRSVHCIEKAEPNEWLTLLASYHLNDDKEALAILLRSVDEYLTKPAWGNPREDGYGHNGDMTAAFALRGFGLVLSSLIEELGVARRQKMLSKVETQGRRFLEQALLSRDYWGGSLLQDHGWRSMLSACCAAIRLLPFVPEAHEWLRYLLPRAHRAMAAMPRDGVVPQSSHNSLVLYLDDVSELREALLAWSGEDLYDTFPFHEVVDFVAAVHAPGGSAAMIGGSGFFNQMAAKYGDGTAAALSRQQLEIAELDWTHPVVRVGYHTNIVLSFQTYEPSVGALTIPAVPFHFYPDSALVHFQDAAAAVTFSVYCGPWIGWHADHNATGPCDRMGLAPGAGHFALTRHGVDLLATPDGGYSLQSALRSCLLIAGRGQYGDIGYPMSIPSKMHRGEAIETARWDADSQRGIVRLQLAPAYDESTGVAAYTREFILEPDRLVVRDHIVLDDAKPLTWLFQLKRDNGVQLITREDGSITAAIGGECGVHLSVGPQPFELQAEIRPTPVVWSYTSINGFKPFDSLCFETKAPVRTALLDFVIQW